MGFLGSLLQTLSGLELVPREMWVATRDGEACDRFLLSSSDGTLPSDDKRLALEEALDTYQRRR